MKKYLLSSIFTLTIGCYLFVIYGQDVKIKNLSETDDSHIMSEELRSDTSTINLTSALVLPDTTRMVSVRKIMLLTEKDSINSVSSDTISRHTSIVNRWNVSQ